MIKVRPLPAKCSFFPSELYLEASKFHSNAVPNRYQASPVSLHADSISSATGPLTTFSAIMSNITSTQMTLLVCMSIHTHSLLNVLKEKLSKDDVT